MGTGKWVENGNWGWNILANLGRVWDDSRDKESLGTGCGERL